MGILSKCLVVLAFAALVGVAIFAWQCMKLTREEQPDRQRLRKMVIGLIACCAAAAVCYLLSLIVGAGL